jgi:hypothetical protein
LGTGPQMEIALDFPIPIKNQAARGMPVDEVRVVVNPHEKLWSFGIGEEGVQDCPEGGTGEQCMVVDEVFPWWWSSLKAVGITVNRIWLTSYSDVGVGSLAISYCKRTPVEIGHDPTQAFWSDLHSCEILAIGGKIPDCLMTSEMWKSTKLRMVICTSRSRVQPPSTWLEQSHSYEHSEVGGVTNGMFRIFSYTKLGGQYIMGSAPRRLGQDLRWVLKVNQPGETAKSAGGVSGSEAGSTVKYWKRGVVLSSGLYPILYPNTKVHTLYRGNQWVIRELNLTERLLILDVPEKLVKQCKEEGWKDMLVKGMHTPGKVLQCAIHVLLRGKGDAVCERGSKRKREGETTTGLQQKEKKVRQDDSTPLHGYEGKLSGVLRKREVDDSFVARSFRKKEASVPSRMPLIAEGSGDETDTSVVLRVDPNACATKKDDAEVRIDLWNSHLVAGLSGILPDSKFHHAVGILREFLMRVWRRRVTKDFLSWYTSTTHPCKDSVRTDARDCIQRVCDASWWHWDGGSRPFFWRWPVDYQTIIRNGLPPWFWYEVRSNQRAQREPKNIRLKGVICDKLSVIRNKRYVERGTIDSLMPFFDVPKGEDDVRMVYDGSASGLNESMWAPWFPLPTVDCLVRSLDPGFNMADNDIGEMFHNFVLHPELRKYCGLDMSLYFKEEVKKGIGMSRVWERWNRLAMGLRVSPYAAVQAMLIAQEVIMGDPSDALNIFRWEQLRLNLPGQANYDPSRAWVTKLRRDGSIAADMFIYVDDIRTSAPTASEAWLASQRTSTVLAFLGLQDAARKRRDPGTETGAWTGSVVWTSGGEVSVKTTQEKWDKTRAHIQWMTDNIGKKEGLDMKKMQSVRGFLVYVARTYPSIVPYLKGVHATIDSWRPGRDKDGWKERKKGGKRKREETLPTTMRPWTDELDVLMVAPELGLVDLESQEPRRVFPVPRLKHDLNCLSNLTSAEVPPLRRVRMKLHAKVMYGFGDASKQGFGTSIELPDKKLMWRYGQWRLTEEQCATDRVTDKSLVEERSSNYRELRNLVEALEDAFDKGVLHDREIFMFTDNSTAEAAFFKGTSSSELLFNLIIRLRKIEMSGVCIIHMIHVAGTRMIWQGTDGLSRGDWNAGVMAGESMISFVPLHQSVCERNPAVEDRFRKWMNEGIDRRISVVWLTPQNWASNMTVRAVYVWTPPPAAADVAAEYLARAIHKRPNSTHMFICPRLMTARWLRVVRKTSDVILRIPVGCCIWGIDQHEPLILALCFPLSGASPWKHGGTAECDQFGKLVQVLLESDFDRAGVELCKFISHTWGVAAL